MFEDRIQQLRQRMTTIEQLTAALLNNDATENPLTGELREFTAVIHSNILDLMTMLAPALDALAHYEPGQAFPGDMHNIRSPLVAVMGYADVVEQGVIGTITATQQAIYKQIYDHGLRVSEMLEEIYVDVKANLLDV